VISLNSAAGRSARGPGELPRVRNRVTPAFAEAERLELVLGITCRAVYHAGQVQLLKRLREYLNDTQRLPRS